MSGRSERTVKRHWQAARAFLFQELSAEERRVVSGAERWTEVRALFEELVELTPAERERRLAALADDALAGPRGGAARRGFRGGPLSRDAGRRRCRRALRRARGSATELPPPERIGPYRVLAAPRARRNGRGPSRRAGRRPLRAARRDQAAAPRHGVGRRAPALLAGAAHPRAPRASAHRAAARRRRDRGRAAVLRHGARRGRAHHGVLPRARSSGRRPPSPARRLLRRGRGGAPQPRRPPGPQALQRARHEETARSSCSTSESPSCSAPRTPGRRPPRRTRSCGC